MELRLITKWCLISLAYLIIMASCNNASSEKSTSNEGNQSKEVLKSEPDGSIFLSNSQSEKLASGYGKDKSPLYSVEKESKPEHIKPSVITLEVPPNINSELPDFSKYKNTVNKKKAFFAFLEPIIVSENKKVLAQRDYILSLEKCKKEGNVLTPDDSAVLEDFAIKYRVDYEKLASEDFFEKLLMHVDIIPTDLALAQAANESAWGSSYFARHGNNLFGQWCFTPGCGIVPRKRHKDDTHEVAVYDNLSQSIASYIQYLNSHPVFRKLRKERYEARKNGKEPSGYDMATGLKAYSARGTAYVKTLQSMIKKNKKYMGLYATTQSGETANAGSL